MVCHLASPALRRASCPAQPLPRRCAVAGLSWLLVYRSETFQQQTETIERLQKRSASPCSVVLLLLLASIAWRLRHG